MDCMRFEYTYRSIALTNCCPIFQCDVWTKNRSDEDNRLESNKQVIIRMMAFSYNSKVEFCHDSDNQNNCFKIDGDVVPAAHGDRNYNVRELCNLEAVAIIHSCGDWIPPWIFIQCFWLFGLPSQNFISNENLRIIKTIGEFEIFSSRLVDRDFLFTHQR